MRPLFENSRTALLTFTLFASAPLAVACGGSDGDDGLEGGGGSSAGDGDGDAAAGDGDAVTGDGDNATGDGDATTGDGDAATGDGDNATGDGDGDNPVTPGDGDGWDEPACSTGSLDAAEALYHGSNFQAVSIAIAEARYPIAKDFFEADNDESLAQWYQDWGEGDGMITFQEVLDRFNTAAHESGHGYDFDSGYKLNETYTIPALSFFDSIWFPNADIVKYHEDSASDGYFDVYLVGDIAQQNLSTLLSEYNQYTHSLAIGVCLQDVVQEHSARDGALTMMYYIALYVKTARLDHPEVYTKLTENHEDALRMILLNWDRSEFWLKQSESNPNLGIDDDKISGWLYKEDVVGEIETLRQYFPM